jgi:hypothetical protein
LFAGLQFELSEQFALPRRQWGFLTSTMTVPFAARIETRHLRRSGKAVPLCVPGGIVTLALSPPE